MLFTKLTSSQCVVLYLPVVSVLFCFVLTSSQCDCCFVFTSSQCVGCFVLTSKCVVLFCTYQ